MNITDFRIEHRTNPLGIDAAAPRFSWKLDTPVNNTLQESYRIVVSCGAQTLWDSGVVESRQSVCVVYAGAPLLPKTEYRVLLSVTANQAQSARTEAVFETGLMTWENMSADWITHGFADDPEACAVFCKEFSCAAPIARARLYASALGI